MSYLNLKSFSGTQPRTGPTELGPNQAQIAKNTKLQSGEIRAWRKPLYTYTPGLTDVRTIYKLQTASSSAWLEFQQDVDIVPGPVADTTDYRLYYTSSAFGPRKTNWALATTSGTGTKPFPNTYYEMGVPSPIGAPGLSASGGTAPTETRAYVYTYVTQFGSVLEESAPSPAATVTCNTSGSTVVVNGFSPAPAGNYNFQYIRIYRSVTGASSITYQLVAQVPASTITYNDTVTVSNLGQTLTSLYYTPPPSTLQGIVAMPNGMLAGFTGNQIWFCEPYLPHAWPSTYMLTTDYPIVGLGVFGNTLFVGTTKNPYLISGSTPSAMTQEKLSILQPCVSKKSIVSDQSGVMYASPNGLVAIGPGVQQVITNAIYTRDEWSALVPTTMIGALYNNMYIGFYTAGGTVQSLAIIKGDNPPVVDLEMDGVAIFVEPNTSAVYVVKKSDNLIYQLDADTVNNTLYQWKSKKFILPEPTNFACLKAHADFDYLAATTTYNSNIASIITANNTIWATGNLKGAVAKAPLNTYVLGGSAMAVLPSLADTRYVTCIIYADGNPMYTGNVISGEPVRLPATTRAYVWEIYFTGNAPLREFHMATSMAELRQQGSA